MSQILNVANSSIALCAECCTSDIPDKVDVINMMKCSQDTDGNDPINMQEDIGAHTYNQAIYG